MSLKYLTVVEAAAVIGVKRTTMQNLVNDGAIRYSDVGRNGRKRVRIAEDDLRAFMESRSNVREDGAA